MKKNFLRGPGIFIIIIVGIVLLSMSFGSMEKPDPTSEIGYTELLKLVKDGKIAAIQVTDNELTAIEVGSTKEAKNMPKVYDYITHIPSQEILVEGLLEATGEKNLTEIKFPVVFNPPPEPSFFAEYGFMIILLVALVIFWVVMMRQAQGGGKAMNFGKSRAKMTLNPKSKKTFADVAGADEEKEELEEIVEFLKRPQAFLELGARIPKGVLLVGPPGGGKTLLAKAVAGEAGVPFFSISGSDFVEMFVGVGASRVRDLFDNAKKNAPCIIFIDEIDAVGRKRGAGLGGGHDEREQTLNQLLVEMDGFQVNEGIIVIAATNRKDILDPALLRAGRFDRQIVVNYPDVKGREEILKVHSKGKPLADDVKLATLAKMTPGFIGADLENVLNEAAILTARHKKKKIGMVEIEEAITRIIAGPEKKSRVITEKDKKCTAYHEVGHAVVAHLLPNCDPVHEVSIIPRGMAAGYTLTLPDNDDRHLFKSAMLDTITMMLGGRVAEKLILGDISTGASNDIQRATEAARSMVAHYGMSDLIGTVYYGGEQEVFLGNDFGHQKSYSESVGAQIDSEIKRIIGECFEKAEQIISDNMDLMHKVTAVLIDREKITGEEFAALMKGEELPEKPAEEAAEEAPAAEAPVEEAPAEAPVFAEESVNEENENA